jgi:DNA-binding HxlR family transcriptional regulator
MKATASDQNCPTRKVLENISKKWATLVLCMLAENSHRFSELLHAVPGISQKVLTQVLRTLERDGLVKREVNASTVPITVTYSLTELGGTLAEPMAAIKQWSEQHIQEVTQAQKTYDKKRKLKVST